ncbi:MAG TPA: hypothetical protein VFH50_07530 [Acidimicrobiales bacterium]|nr:hypothetical protein [Acidimicrobiales bacterium]
MQRRSDPDHDAEARRRYDRDGLVRAGGPEVRRMVTVVDQAGSLSRQRCEELAAAFRQVSDSPKGELEPRWFEVFRYAWPHPQHPPDLYAIDPVSRAVMNYAGIVGRERAAHVMGPGAAGVGLVERAVVGAVLALAADRAAAGGWYTPLPAELVPLLRRPWTDVMGAPAEAAAAEVTSGGGGEPGRPPGPMVSHPCREADLALASFEHWAEAIRPGWDGERTAPGVIRHRKLWEWLFIIQALDERGMLEPGKRGLGFGVGTEPLVSYFAGRGCHIVATDLDPLEAEAVGWDQTNQYAGSIDGLNPYGLCDGAQFRARTSFRVVNMNSIPPDLRDFDFNWSSCAFEHLGSIELGIRFVNEQMETLRPGGVAVHTTEFNVESDDATVESGGTVIFRRRDIEEMAARLRRSGHRVECDFSPGQSEADRHVDVEPYTTTHLRVSLGGYVTTSFGLIVEKGQRSVRSRLTTARSWVPRLTGGIRRSPPAPAGTGGANWPSP